MPARTRQRSIVAISHFIENAFSSSHSLRIGACYRHEYKTLAKLAITSLGLAIIVQSKSIRANFFNMLTQSKEDSE